MKLRKQLKAFGSIKGLLVDNNKLVEEFKRMAFSTLSGLPLP
jgi:hypothetical protein